MKYTLDEYHAKPWLADDYSTDAAFHSGQARVEGQIKDAAAKGINPGVSSAPGGMIPPPPGYDPYHGKTCMAPGFKRNGFGNAKVCGRQAVAQLRKFTPDIPEARSAEAQAEAANAMLGFSAYGGSANPVTAYTMAPKGHMVSDPNSVDPNGTFVCPFHSQARFAKEMHPDDNGGRCPRPKIAPPIIGLDKLNIRRQWRCVQTDATFAWVTDGLVTVMCAKQDYIRFLADNGILPEFGQPLP